MPGRSRRARIKAIFRDHEQLFAAYRNPDIGPAGTRWIYEWYNRWLSPQIAEMVETGSVRRAVYNMLTHCRAGNLMHLHVEGRDPFGEARGGLCARLEVLLLEETGDAPSVELEAELVEVETNIVVLSSWVADAQEQRNMLIRELRSRGYTVAELARLARLTPARVHQILAAPLA